MLDFGEKGGKFMKNGTSYTNEPIGRIKIIKDFLPSPDELVYKEENVKVTINLRRSSINFFKQVANKSHTKYQRVIRSLLDEYASRYQKAA